MTSAIKTLNSQHLTATTCLCSWWCRSYDRGVKTSSTPHHYNFLVLLLLQKLGVWLSCQNPKLLNTWSPLVTCTSAAEARTQLSKPYTFNNSPPQLTCASGAAEAMTEASKPWTPQHRTIAIYLCSWYCKSYDWGIKTLNSSTPHHRNLLVLLVLQEASKPQTPQHHNLLVLLVLQKLWLRHQNLKLLNTTTYLCSWCCRSWQSRQVSTSHFSQNSVNFSLGWTRHSMLTSVGPTPPPENRNMGKTRLKFESWKVRIHTQNARHFYSCCGWL